MKFYIRPQVGALPIKFGMTKAEVAQVLGPAVATFLDSSGECTETRTESQIVYNTEDKSVSEVGFSADAQLLFEGQNLFGMEDPTSFLCRFDTRPYNYGGSVIFLELGVAITGFEGNTNEDRSIGVFCKGRYDEDRAEFTDYHLLGSK